MLALAAALVLLGLNASRMDASRIGAYAILAVAVGLYAATGRLIISRLPGNAVGWLLGLIGLSLAAAMLTEQYALYGLATAPGTVPAARLAGWCSGTLASLTVALLFFLVLLFPDGRLPSRRWRPVLWAMFAVVAGWVAQQLQAGTTTTGGITNALVVARVSYPNPLGVFPRHGWFSGLLEVLFDLALATAVLAVVSVFVRRRGASAELRKQLGWLGYVGLMTACWAAVGTIIELATHGANGWLGTFLWAVLVLIPVAGIPLACAVAVLKYRLYEIDRIISRTLAYAIVTGLLVGRVRRAGAAGHPGAAAARLGRGRGIHAGRGGVVHPAAVTGAADRRPPVQPDPVQRGPDRDRIRRPPEGRRGPGLGAR